MSDNYLSLGLGFRLVVAGVFLIAGAVKLLRRSSDYIEMAEASGLLKILPVKSAMPLVPLFELVMGIWLASAVYTREALIVSLAVLSLFSAVLIGAIRGGYQKNCGCFGASKGKASASDVISNFLLVAFCAVSLFDSGKRSLLEVNSIDILVLLSSSLWIMAVRSLLRQIESFRSVAFTSRKGQV